MDKRTGLICTVVFFAGNSPLTTAGPENIHDVVGVMKGLIGQLSKPLLSDWERLASISGTYAFC